MNGIAENTYNFWMSGHQIQDPERRKMAIEAMTLLWKAMDLSNGCGGITVGHGRTYVVHELLYGLVGQTILGDDCPWFEVLC